MFIANKWYEPHHSFPPYTRHSALNHSVSRTKWPPPQYVTVNRPSTARHCTSVMCAGDFNDSQEFGLKGQNFMHKKLFDFVMFLKNLFNPK